MHLKSIVASGFKSFAEKTTINLSEYTNVIVGPNGSGKSNIVDAISWVLGNQSPFL
jgi:chromosome segregation protein